MKKLAIKTSGILLTMVMLCTLLPLSSAHTAAPSQNGYTVTVTNGKAYSDSGFTTVITSAQAGDKVYFMEDSSALPENHYWSDITYTGISESDVAPGGGKSYLSGVFTMPSGAVEIAYVYKASTPLTIDFTSAESVAVGAAGWDGVMGAKQNGLIKMDIDGDGSADWDFGPMADATILLTNTCSVSGTYNYTLVNNPISPLTFIFPAPVTKYPVWVGATQVTSANKDDILSDGRKAKYAPETNTLTLNDPTVSGSHKKSIICYNPGPGDPDLLKITGSATINDGSTEVGILGIESSIELNGTFNVTGTEWGIGAFNVTVSGGTVTAHGGESGISSQKEIIISGGTVNATGDTKCGIESDENNVTISGGKVSATGRTSGIIATVGSIVISGGEVTAKALVPYESAAVSAGKDITISGGMVTAQDGNNGIRALNGTISIENGTEKVLADGTTYTIRADSILIGDDMMIKEPQGGTIENRLEGTVIMDGSSIATHALIVPKTAATCKVTFDSKGGSAVSPQTVASGGKATKPADPTREGFAFTGWYSDSDASVPYDFDTPVTGNITLYAGWIQYIYIINVVKVWNDDNAAGLRPETINVRILANGTQCTTLTLKKDEDWKQSYLYPSGEADVELSCEEVVPTGYILESMVKTGNTITLTNAIAPAPTRKVTFDANGHGTAPAAQTVEAGKAAAKPADPAETGWIFDGWYTEAACTNAFDFSTPITDDITLYAKWTEESITPVEITYTVTSGGNSTWIKDSNSNVIITVERSEADETCFSHFSGVQIDGTTLAAGDYEARSGSTVITLKAATLQKQSVGDHTVTINFDDGKAETKLTVKAASPAPTAASKPTDVPKTGHSANFPLWLGSILLGLIGISVLGLTAIRYRK